MTPADSTSQQRRKAISQFWDRVDRDGRCWTWIGPYRKDTVIAQVGGAVIQALPHRFAAGWIREVPLNSATTVARTCGNDDCVRPSHLSIKIDSPNGHARRHEGTDYKRAGEVRIGAPKEGERAGEKG